MSRVDRHRERERSRFFRVIPGRLEEASPESIGPQECSEKWIPDSRLRGFRNDDALRSAKGVKNDALRHAMPLRDKPGPTLFLQQRWTPDQQRNTSVALRPRNAIRTARHSGARVQRANPESRDSGSDAYAPSRNDQKADRRRCTISPAPERTQSCAISTLWAAPQIMGTILNPA